MQAHRRRHLPRTTTAVLTRDSRRQTSGLSGTSHPQHQHVSPARNQAAQGTASPPPRRPRTSAPSRPS
jgi:hypothetical protein